MQKTKRRPILVLDALVCKDSGWTCAEHPGRVECHRRLEFVDPPSRALRRDVARYLASNTPDWRDVNPTWQGAWGSVRITRVTAHVWEFHCVMHL